MPAFGGARVRRLSVRDRRGVCGLEGVLDGRFGRGGDDDRDEGLAVMAMVHMLS